jgi:hypothetical protein
MAVISTANAREMAAKSHAARRQRAAQAAQRATPTVQMPPVADGFVAERLSRTREHIEQLNRLFAVCSDPHKLDRLASAISRMSEIERVLAGRPLPGSFRPARIKARPTMVAVMPLDD